jgi:hypothetical protein
VSWGRRLLVALAASLPLYALPTPVSALDENPLPAPTWVDTFGPVALSSPTVAQLDGVTAVIFCSESGYVDAVNATTGSNLPGWPEPVELAPGKPSAIESSPTVAYLDGPSKPPTIIVGAGSTYVPHQQGGLVAFRPDGRVRFVFHTRDVFNEWTGTRSPAPDGFDEGVFSTPAVGDLTGNGQQDIVFGSWDHRIYALTPSGHLVPGFPLETEDTIWSSPALFHVRGAKGRDDIFIGGDASGRDHCYGGFVYDITVTPRTARIVWQHCENQTIWSSPAVGLLTPNGRPVVVVGSGFGERPPYKSDTDRLFAFYAQSGTTVRGWPVKTEGPTFGSPAIGVLTPGGPIAVVDTSWCTSCTTPESGASVVDAWSGSGRRLWTTTLAGSEDFASPVLADVTGSGTNDVLVGSSAGLYALDGATGSYILATSELDAINICSVQNAPAIADVDGAGPGTGWRLFETCGGPEKISPTGHLFDYPLPAAPLTPPPWPMWRENPSHDGVAHSTFVRSDT